MDSFTDIALYIYKTLMCLMWKQRFSVTVSHQGEDLPAASTLYVPTSHRGLGSLITLIDHFIVKTFIFSPFDEYSVGRSNKAL